MQKIKKFIKSWVPLTTIFPYGSVFLLQCFGYFITQLFANNRTQYDFTIDFDRNIPLIPLFVYIYLVCYAFWVINQIICGKVSKHHFYKVLTTLVISNTISTIIFIIMPTTIVRPEIETNSFTTWVLNLVYTMDKPVNLFPSLHCSVSWLCYIGVRKRSVFSKGYRAFSLIFAILICVSTQVIKQHYIVDLIVGVLLAEMIWWVVNKTNCYRPVQNFFEIFNHKLKFLWPEEAIEVHEDER